MAKRTPLPADPELSQELLRPPVSNPRPRVEATAVPSVQRYLFPAVVGVAALSAIVLLLVSPRSDQARAQPSSPVSLELQPYQEIQVGPGTLRSIGERAARLTVIESKRDGIMLSGIILSSGRIELRINPAEQSYQIATPSFRLESADTAETAVEVGIKSVRLRRGAVAIYATSGETLKLEAGQSWTVGELSIDSAGGTAAAPTAVPRASAAELPELAGAPQPQTAEPQVAQPPALQPKISAASWVARGRKALAKGRVARALAAVSRALAAEPSSRVRAEAETLRAEAAKVAGQYGRALRLYLVVADRYRSTPAGENALFAAAGLAARRGDRARARELFGRYRTDYPKGRFYVETGEWLERLR